MLGRESKCIEILVDKIVRKKSHMVSSVVEQFAGVDSLVENMQPFSLHEIQEDPGNIIQNHDFSRGVDEPWELMHGKYTFIHPYGYKGIPAAKEGSTHFAWVKHRTEKWQGLEQEITSKVAPDTIYMLSACIRLRNVEAITKVQATLRLEPREKKETYLNIGRDTTMAEYCNRDSEKQHDNMNHVKQFTSNIKDINIIQNPEFLEDGKQWARNLCRAEFSKSLGCARTTNRVKYYSGIEQDISARVQKGLVYELNVEVRVSGDDEEDVDATIQIRRRDLSTSNGLVARLVSSETNRTGNQNAPQKVVDWSPLGLFDHGTGNKEELGEVGGEVPSTLCPINSSHMPKRFSTRH
ncbi:hypothetical protein RJ639_023644 [Escallonia herrerae]|uniref:Uncharacterized protein n=1 Tax=Escallonia herrerae TaxID=1293975 RepID=A0AA89AEK5_9ASTE|nr:hypothetical protein RJ639_023644 [Escallonia herrerae]